MKPTHQPTRDELKAKLLAEVEQALDQLMGWKGKTPSPTLTQIEGAVLAMRNRKFAGAPHLLLLPCLPARDFPPG